VPRLEGAAPTPHALEVARLAAGRLLAHPFDAQALFALEPHYVRASEAEVKFPKGLGPGADR
jgi:tRNA threonylcarbamoyladenosine biosynthesis protein TsaB